MTTNDRKPSLFGVGLEILTILVELEWIAAEADCLNGQVRNLLDRAHRRLGKGATVEEMLQIIRKIEVETARSRVLKRSKKEL